MSSLNSGVATQPLTPRQARLRYRRIVSFAARELVSLWWFELVLPRFGLSSIAQRTRIRRMRNIARRFRRLALALSGLLIKLGQFMSTRSDVLPVEITRELSDLQDAVPAVDFVAIAALAERELGVSLGEVFAWIDEEPLAAASLGQVHRARLSEPDAELYGFADVVIKVQRPGIADVVEVDLRALRRVALWLSRIRLVNTRADAPALLEEFATTCYEEIDYLNEGANAEHFAENFADNPRVRVPVMVWERTSRRILTQQDVADIKITDLAALHEAGINPADVADEFARIMLDQVLIDGFFHADPHPGNVFVQPLPAETPGGKPNWRITFIDFGMMGRVPVGLAKALRTTVIAATGRDGAGLVEGMREIGVLMPNADTLELERTFSRLFERFGGMGFAELQKVDLSEYRALALEFSDTIRSLPFQFPENFLLVVRSLSLISGMCSALNPEFNIWTAIEPYSTKLVRAGGSSAIQGILETVSDYARVVVRLPQRVDKLVTRAEHGQLTVRSLEVERRVSALNRSVRRVISAVLFGALFIGGLVIYARAEVLGIVVLCVSALPLLHAVFAEWFARRGPLP